MLLAHLLLLSTSAHAAEFGVGGYVGHWAITDAETPPGYVYGGRLRFRFNDDFGIEAVGGVTATGFDPQLELDKFFPNNSKVTPFLALGGGVLVSDVDPMWLAGVGGGIDAELLKWLDFRADARVRMLGEEKVVTSILFNTGLQVHTSRVHDADGDGVRDREDQCKDVAEDKDNFEDTDGCPDLDNDKDGIPDGTDECIDKAEDKDGFQDNNGCPDDDNDSDGLADTADKCPNDAEDKDAFEDTDGCPDPDNDKDGIGDNADKCPTEPETINGFRDRDGCADEVPAEVARFSGVIAGVNFETNKAVLLPTSKKILDEAAEVLTKFPDIRLEVQGHTDNVGKPEKNLKLSQERAQSVVDYLVSKGIAKDRLEAKGYGDSMPKVPNDTKAGQAENRRVEFKRL